MKMIKKRIIAFIMIMAVCLTMMPLTAMADEYPEVGFDFEAYEAQEKINGTPKKERWSYTSSTAQGMSIDKKEATAAVSVTGYKDKVDKIVIYMYIQQLNDGSWKTLSSSRYEVDNWHAEKEKTYSPCPHGYTYRLKASYYVYSGDDYEYISATSANYVYN